MLRLKKKQYYNFESFCFASFELFVAKIIDFEMSGFPFFAFYDSALVCHKYLIDILKTDETIVGLIKYLA